MRWKVNVTGLDRATGRIPPIPWWFQRAYTEPWYDGETFRPWPLGWATRLWSQRWRLVRAWHRVLCVFGKHEWRAMPGTLKDCRWCGRQDVFEKEEWPPSGSPSS